MGKVRKINESTKKRYRPPALTPEARENQLIDLAIDLAEQQLLDGTASSQVITHYLKLGTTRERLEQKKLEEEVELAKAKKESLESSKRIEELYLNALNAMKVYSGRIDDDDDEEEY